MQTLQQIDGLAKDYSEARQRLRDLVNDLNDQIEAVKKKALPGIRRAVETTAARESTLRSAVQERTDLFKRPRSLVFHGIKVGFQKAKGQLLWEDDGVVVKALKKLFPEAWETYVQVIEKPMKSALAGLAGADLKRIGVTVTNDTDEVLIKSTDSDIDKLVNAWLKKEAEDES
jgi:hypothetical protein